MTKAHCFPWQTSTSRKYKLLVLSPTRRLIIYRTSDEFSEYITTYYFPNVTETELSTLLELYPDDVTQGSPYDTGYLNAVTPQFKRIASFLGDAVFQAPRRYFLQSIASDQPVWSYLSKRLKSLPVLGSVSVNMLSIPPHNSTDKHPTGSCNRPPERLGRRRLNRLPH
jgi:hypothetical protein